ncbi:transporter substrate-binding domain-containing protein [Marinobacter lutaoensis]|jgi:polar amino acid transport system substrate-binding protein|uniref:ABC transporter substrate-binding protein n=1 Tax=Marinobacter lutaoensis TaxID=135739 RepID=A0A1V2DS63_9GAMM|nr:transporter substrate-binding domain-containing protein [Marinobacter lutaoensis]MBE02473.1 ABC transporter substrate-binding protein [Marinobacter sp.]MBI43883.1 ABC transporter substrate-binding protein [Oceanospirillales bacterium]ONF43472.1 ABC transporter substrate-binding protein [Marinobacter lutaoensis]
MRKGLLLTLILWLAACSSEEPPEPGTRTTEAAAVAADTVPAQARIVLAADPWCPHNCVAGATPEGYMIDIARAVFGAAGMTVDYQNISWARSLQLAQYGKVDGVVGAFVGDAPAFVFPEEPAGYSRIDLFTRPDSLWRYAGTDSLADRVLVVLNGYSYSAELDTYIRDHQDENGRVWVLSGPSPLDRAIRLVLEGRADVLPEDRDVMRWTLANELPGLELRVAGGLAEAPIYIAFSPANPRSREYARLLSDGIRELRASGRLARILDGYGVTWPAP